MAGDGGKGEERRVQPSLSLHRHLGEGRPRLADRRRAGLSPAEVARCAHCCLTSHSCWCWSLRQCWHGISLRTSSSRATFAHRWRDGRALVAADYGLLRLTTGLVVTDVTG